MVCKIPMFIYILNANLLFTDNINKKCNLPTDIVRNRIEVYINTNVKVMFTDNININII